LRECSHENHSEQERKKIFTFFAYTGLISFFKKEKRHFEKEIFVFYIYRYCSYENNSEQKRKKSFTFFA
jgi:hypothetical protein